ncbi:helix-turn-helix domain-containing protein [Nocardia tengchongensis]|uniref:helix-turn-helix domain-containing protein n=1 Tax=Nocardia tengchongensis TaxID=2055889 RepID=UPI0036BB6B5A
MQEAWTGADATALRTALGVSQAEFAERTGVALSTVKKWARRGTTVTLPPFFAELMETHLTRATPQQRARLLATRRERVEIVVLGDADGPIDSIAAQWEPGMWTADCTAIAHDLSRKDLMLDRRQAARALLGVVVGANLLEPMERWLLYGTGQTADLSAITLYRVGIQEVEQLENAARVFREWDDQYGGGLRRKAVIGQLTEVNEILTHKQPIEIRRRLTVVLALLAETVATMSWDSGQQATAQRYYVLAVRAARAAGDSAFAANALAGMARQLLYLGRTADALELVRLAQEQAATATPTVQAMLRTREAWAYAHLDRPSAFHRACDRAQETMSEAEPSIDPYWICYFDNSEMAGTIGGRLLEMAQRAPEFARDAADQIDRAIVLRQPNRLRSTALDQLGLAEARLIQGELEEACRLGHAALSTVEQTASDRVRVKLREMFAHTEHVANIRVVAELRDRMRVLVADPV